MDNNGWAQVGTVIVAFLTLAGIVYSTRQRPEQSVVALGQVMKNLGDENTRLNTRIDEMDRKMGVMQAELTRLGHVERELVVYKAGAGLLYNQVIAHEHIPVWTPPPDRPKP